jgi:hypothetical protein
MPEMTLAVGIVLARRKAASRWIDWIWEARTVLQEPAAAEPGTRLGEDGDETLIYGGPATIAIHTNDTQFYRDNLTSGAPTIWVVLRTQAGDGLPQIVTATCDPTEGEGYTETGWDIVNAVPMPQTIAAALAAVVEQHHVEAPFIKRKRDRQDPEALAQGRRGPERDRFLREHQARAESERTGAERKDQGHGPT